MPSWNYPDGAPDPEPRRWWHLAANLITVALFFGALTLLLWGA